MLVDVGRGSARTVRTNSARVEVKEILAGNAELIEFLPTTNVAIVHPTTFNSKIMDLPVEFFFRKKRASCTVYIDSSTNPCYVFVVLKDPDLIAEFGEDITIKTDFEKRLPKQDDYPALIAMRESIFAVIRYLPEFLAAHRKIEFLKQEDLNLQRFVH